MPTSAQRMSQSGESYVRKKKQFRRRGKLGQRRRRRQLRCRRRRYVVKLAAQLTARIDRYLVVSRCICPGDIELILQRMPQLYKTISAGISTKLLINQKKIQSRKRRPKNLGRQH